MQSKAILYSAVAVLIVVIAIAILFMRNMPNREFSNAYRELQFGMSKDQVLALFDDTPDFDCKYKSSDIWYFQVPDPLVGDFDDVELDRGASVKHLDELPDIYDCVLLAFDSNDELHAYTWIGEELFVQSTKSKIAGSHFNVLSSSDFDLNLVGKQ